VDSMYPLAKNICLGLSYVHLQITSVDIPPRHLINKCIDNKIKNDVI
jgi:hypothetical protein